MIPVRSILFITLTNIGDVIMTLPVLSVLRGNFPDAKITVLAGPRSFELFSGSQTVDEIIIWEKNFSWFDKAILIRELRRREFDVVVDLKNTAIQVIVNPPVRTSVFRQGIKKFVSKRDQHLACLKPLRADLTLNMDLREPFHFFSPTEMNSVVEKLRSRGIRTEDLVLMAPGANSALKRWHAEGFAETADRLKREKSKTVLFVGAKGDSPVIDEILARTRESHVDFSGATNLRELAALMSRADLVVSNDSSPLQLAYELDVPAVAVFGPTNEKKFGRTGRRQTIVRRNLPCTPCEAPQCLIPDTKSCLLKLESAEVYDACLAMMSRSEVSANVGSA